jgi:hypothetical protein
MTASVLLTQLPFDARTALEKAARPDVEKGVPERALPPAISLSFLSHTNPTITITITVTVTTPPTRGTVASRHC